VNETFELMIIDAQNAVQIFTGGGMAAILDGIEAKVRAIKLDPSTAPGREEIRSVAYKIARTKTALDAEGKRLTEAWREATAKVNLERKKSAERLESLQQEVRKPLTDFENKEKLRVQAHEDSMRLITGMRERLTAYPDMILDLLLKHQHDAETLLPEYNWEEFESRAQYERAALAKYITSRVDSRRIFEAEQHELARLRKADAERIQRERDERLKAEAAEAARLAAERKAEAEADAEALRVIEAAERERKRVADETERVRVEHERAQRAIEDARCREEQAKLAAEKRAREAEEARIASERKSEESRVAAEKRSAAELKAAQKKAEHDAKEAVQRERARQAQDRKDAEAAQAKREADKKLRANVRAEIIADLVAVNVTGSVEGIADAILAGRVRHVRVVF
jgi:hypothetical protein